MRYKPYDNSVDSYSNEPVTKQVDDSDFYALDTVKNEFGTGYGWDAYEISVKQLERLIKGEVLVLHSQGEYSVYLRVRPE